ncbi:MAG: tungstate transport system ATP-binding protein, partial [Bacteroidetes bacterium]
MKLDVTDLKKYYNGRLVLDVERLAIGSGRIIALIGPNGSGKSTLLRLLKGIEKAEAGNILYDGSDALPDGDIAFQPQQPYIFDLTVAGNVKLGLQHAKMNIHDCMIRSPEATDCEMRSPNEANDREQVSEAVTDALKNVRMEGFANARAIQLSVGEKQRVALARTLTIKKRLILLDEPASSIDILSMKLVEDYMRRVNTEHLSTVAY